MASSHGQVMFNDEPIHSKLTRFCEKKIEKWLASHSIVGDQNQLKNAAMEFRVSFAEEDGSRRVSCSTEIKLGNICWRGADLGPDSQQAFIHSLKRLTPH